MDLEKPNFHTTKLLTTWFDLYDHYVLAVMLAVSVASVGLQTTQDRLVCIPAVNCSDFARNDSVVRRWKEYRDASDSCNQSPSLVVLTKMSDRRQYDYIDNECYKKLHWFSAYYSLIFLTEALALLAVSNYWQKYSNGANALAHCEHLLLDFIKGEIFSPKDEDEQQQQLERQRQQQTQQKQAEQKLFKRLKVFEKCYSQDITKFNFDSVTWQYRARGVMGIFSTILLLVFNVISYSHSTEFTQCHLDGHVAFSTKHRFFQCTRSRESYFKIGSNFIFILLGLHLFYVCYSFVWSLIGERWRPVYKIISEKGKPLRSDEDAASLSGHESTPTIDLTNLTCDENAAASLSGHESTVGRTLLTYVGDAAFLFHLIHESNYFLITVIRCLLEEEEEKKRSA